MSASQLRLQFQLLSVTVCLAGMGILFVFILRATDGAFIYTLDDPYIHLSLAENLLRGHYGVNAGEFASPSSSIVYPFLLSIMLAFGLGTTAPIVLNLIGAVGTAWLLSGFFWDAQHKNKNGRPSVLSYVAIPFLLVSVNGFALGFAGMEHALHVFANLAIIAGLMRLSKTDAPPFYMLLAIVAAPLLRFEGFALAGAALLALAYWGFWTRAITTGAILLAIVAGYMTLMSSLGLPIMPSSILVKSPTTEAATSSSGVGAVLDAIVRSFFDGLKDRQGVALAIGVVLLAIGAVLAKNRSQARTVACVAMAAGVAHLLVGQYNSISRYEIYIIASVLAALFIVWQPQLSIPSRRVLTPAISILVFPVIGVLYIYVTFVTPAAAKNIHDQQFQMHRFATEFFTDSVAVNDLGWVTFENDGYVLDLWGLGSETARQLFHEEGRTPDTVRRLTQTTDVTYAMVYEEWFPAGLPPEWCRIAQLDTVQVTSAFATVEFFLIDHAREADLRTALEEFAPTLPPEASIAIFECDAPTGN